MEMARRNPLSSCTRKGSLEPQSVTGHSRYRVRPFAGPVRLRIVSCATNLGGTTSKALLVLLAGKKRFLIIPVREEAL
jgi:hypothetical protein